jgi:ubiquinone/menaquinone biosynthesis C-methylase UbiE
MTFPHGYTILTISIRTYKGAFMNPVIKFFYNNSFVRSIYHNPVGMFLYHAPMDVLDSITGKADALVPPRWKTFTGRGEYREIARRYCSIFQRLSGLSKNDTVLDIGSGMGRMAVGLTEFLSPQAKYHGIEIVKPAVAWCASRITKQYPNFIFHHADVYNKMYNKKAVTLPGEYRFPFDNDTFDFIFLTSVFTHMRPGDIQQYLAEIRRVLKPQKKFFATAYVINSFSQEQMSAGKTKIVFGHRLADCWTVSAKVPEFDIGLEESWLRRAYKAAGLSIIEPLYAGHWTGMFDNETYQDAIVAKKE